MIFNNKKMLLGLQTKVVYGPVNSRRLGHSLGINILPPKTKICSFDCIYCQYGNHAPKSKSDVISGFFPMVGRITAEVENYFKSMESVPEFITFSGNGEATLHPDFPDIVHNIIRLRNQYVPSARTAILSNSTEVSNPEVRDSLCFLDQRIMKLDAGRQELLSRYNNPYPGIVIDDIVGGLTELKKLTIQSLWSGGPQGNFHQKNISSWIEQVIKIQPDLIQLYTLDRTPPCSSLLPVSRKQLTEISKMLKTVKIESQVF